jgi:quinol monooxygenase YgiN
MDQFAILAILQARPGKENDIEEFLKSARALVLQETGTLSWFAVKLGPARFAIFDTFPDATGRDAHLKGENRSRALCEGRGTLLHATSGRAGRDSGQQDASFLRLPRPGVIEHSKHADDCAGGHSWRLRSLRH